MQGYKENTALPYSNTIKCEEIKRVGVSYAEERES
jgi:hypothetical protein